MNGKITNNIINRLKRNSIVLYDSTDKSCILIDDKLRKIILNYYEDVKVRDG